MKKVLLIGISLVFLLAGANSAMADANAFGEANAGATVNQTDNSVVNSRGNIIHPGTNVMLPHAEVIRPMPVPNDDFNVVPDMFLKRLWTIDDITCITSDIWFFRPDVEAAAWRTLEKNDDPIKLLNERPNLTMGKGPQLIGEVRVVGRSDAPLSQTLGFALKKAKEETQARVVFAQTKGRYRGESSVLALGSVGQANFATGGSSMPDKQMIGVAGGAGIGWSSGELADVIIIHLEIYNAAP